MAFFRRKIPYDALLTAPDNVVEIPAPTKEDIEWAKSTKGKPTENDLEEICGNGELWRIEYALQTKVKSKYSLDYVITNDQLQAARLLLAHKLKFDKNSRRYATRVAIYGRSKEALYFLFEHGLAAKKPFSIWHVTHFYDQRFFDRVQTEYTAGTPLIPLEEDIKNNCLTFKNTKVSIPAPTKEDLAWAYVQDIPTVDFEQFIKACKGAQLWRMAYAIKSGTDVTEQNNAALRAVYATNNYPDIINFLIDLGADSKEALAHKDDPNLSEEERTHLLFGQPKEATPDNDWHEQNDYVILKSTPLNFGNATRIHRQEFNFHARRITSFIEINDVPSNPSYQYFLDLKSDVELREAYNALAKTSEALEPIDHYLPQHLIKKENVVNPLTLAPIRTRTKI